MFGHPIRKAMGLAALILGITLAVVSAEPEPVGEHAVKAAFLYNFTKFVEWPEAISANSKETFLVCVLGEDSLEKSFKHVIGGKRIQEKQVEIKRLEKKDAFNTCRILFVSALEKGRWLAIRESLRHVSVLTVGESERFAEEGGVINFIVQEGKIRFEINPDAAERAHLKLSAKLLALAIIVQDRER